MDYSGLTATTMPVVVVVVPVVQILEASMVPAAQVVVPMEAHTETDTELLQPQIPVAAAVVLEQGLQDQAGLEVLVL